MSTAWSTNVSNWQGVDDEPTAGSDNLVKSGGVYNKISELEGEINGEDKDIEISIDIATSVSSAYINGVASVGSPTYSILKSSSADRCVGFFPCEQGKKYRIHIPLNTNTNSKSVAISRTLLSGSISSNTSVNGLILDSPKGGQSPIDYIIESAPMDGYIAVSYEVSGGLPTCMNLEKQHLEGIISKIGELGDNITELSLRISDVTENVEHLEDEVLGLQREISEDVNPTATATSCYLNSGNSIGYTISIIRSSVTNRQVAFYPCIKGRRYEVHIPKCDYNAARTVSYTTKTHDGQLSDEYENLGGFVIDSPKGGDVGYNDYVIESAMAYPYIAVSYDANGGTPTVVMKYTEVKEGMKEELETLKAFRESTNEFLEQFCGDKKSSTIFQKLGFVKTNNVSHTRCCKIDGNDFYVGYSFGIMKGSLSLYSVPELLAENILISADIVSGHTVTGIDVNDNYLFVATRDNSAGKTIPASGVGGYLYVIDKASLVVVTKIDLKWSVAELYAQGKTNSAEPIYSLTDMTTGNPDLNEVSSGIIKYKAMSCKAVGNTLFVTLQLKGWCAFDITSPSSPVLLYYFSTASGAKECQHIAYWENSNNKYVAFSGFARGVHIFDVTTIGSPIFKGSSTGGVYRQSNHEMFGIGVNYPYMYLTYAPLHAYQTAENATKGLFVYDITNVDNFASTIRYEVILKSEWGTKQDGDGQPNFLAVHNGLAICNIDNVGLASFRVSDKAEFTKAMRLGDGVSIRPICCSEGGIYMACAESAENPDDFGLYFYRIFDIENIKL